jgi:tetratricopeptide (TPR) repeat protein
MRLTSTRLALIAVVAGVLALPTLAVAEGWFSDFDDAKEVSLGEILRNPDDFMGVPVKVKVYFDREGRNHNPYYTRFIAGLYGNFRAWPLNARLYEERDFRRSYPHFYIRKDNRWWKRIKELDRVTPIELECAVRHVFRGQPYFEVFDYDRVSEGMRLDEVRDVVAGDAYYKAGKYEEAADHYYDACSKRQSPADKAVIHRKLADAHFQLGKYRDALRHYEVALENEPESEAIKRGIYAAEDRIRRRRSSATEEERVAPLIDPAPESRHPLVDRSNDVDEIIRLFEPTTEEDQAAAEQAPALVKEDGTAGDEKLAAPEEEDAGTIQMDPESSGPGWVEVPSVEPEEEQPVEQPAEEAVVEPTEEVVEEEPAEVVEPPAEETVHEEPVEEVAEEQPTEEELPVEQPAEGVVEEVVEEEPAEVIEQPAEESVHEEPVEEVAEEQPTVEEQPVEQPAEEAVAEPTEEVVEEEPAEVVEPPVEVVEQPIEEVVEEEPVEETLPASEEGTGETATETEEDLGGVVIPMELDEPVDVEPAAEEPVAVEPEAVVVEEVDEPVAAELEGEDAVEVVEPVVVGSIEIPRLPFFGCEDVTPEQYREILLEIASNPGG